MKGKSDDRLQSNKVSVVSVKTLRHLSYGKTSVVSVIISNQQQKERINVEHNNCLTKNHLFIMWLPFFRGFTNTRQDPSGLSKQELTVDWI